MWDPRGAERVVWHGKTTALNLQQEKLMLSAGAEKTSALDVDMVQQEKVKVSQTSWKGLLVVVFIVVLAGALFVRYICR